MGRPSHRGRILEKERSTAGFHLGRTVSVAAVLTLMIGLMVFFPGRGNLGLDTVAVKGRVTYEGEVLVGGSVSFYPVSRGSGRPSKGSINPDGTYVVKTLLGTSGIVPGEYKIGLVLLELPMGGATPE